MPTDSPSEYTVADQPSNSSGWFIGIIVALTLLAVGYTVYSASAPVQSVATSHVKIQTNGSHGSATHIGNGYFVTAAHVVAGHGDIQIKDDAGNLFDPELLWVNTSYDIALLRLANGDSFETTPLTCDIPAVGATGRAYGNPMMLEDIITSQVVAGEPRQFGEIWKFGLPVDGALAPGMSGGAFVVDGKLAGVNVGVLLAPTSGFSTSMWGVNVVVPGSVVCDLLGRT